MDGRRFDRVARVLATSAGRRGALRLLGAGLLAGSFSRRTGDGVAAQESAGPIPCGQDDDCRDADLDPCTGGACLDGLCTYFIVDCIPGHVCCGNGTCCPTGEANGCVADTDCAQASDDPCAGVRCDNGACVSFLAACAPESACCGNGVCCATAAGCATDGDCAGLDARPRCVSGVCVPARPFV